MSVVNQAQATPYLNEKLNLETAQIHWHELQTHFARGLTIYVDPELDLVNIAHLVAEDSSSAILLLMREGKVGAVTPAQAQHYWQQNRLMWAVVVAPWVLVQPDSSSQD